MSHPSTSPVPPAGQPTSPWSAIVLAAGKGTRMKSQRPKVLFEVLGKPLVSWSVDAVVRAGSDDVVVVVGHGREEVEAVLARRHPEGVRTAVQAEQRGTGHAAQMALPMVRHDDVVVVCGDTPRLEDHHLALLVQARRASASPVAMWVSTLSKPTGYGRIVRDDDDRIARIVEEKDADDATRAITEVNPGVYCFSRSFLEAALPRLSADNAAGELYLTDVVALARKDGHQIADIPVPFEITEGINDRQQLYAAEQWAAEQRRVSLRRSGVTVGEGVHVDADVVVEADVTLGAGVQLRGQTVICSGASIDVGCVITDTRIGAGVTIHPYCVCDQAVVAEDAIIGPYARLRPAADVRKGAHVGNFVELKKTVLGEGSKANHLAYLGDAVIGAGVNVGAGTITCNYDGVLKHQTTLGDGVFVGSNSTLVAPLTVHDGAYVAAGSVITADVDADAIAFGRARQVDKPGAATGLRARQRQRRP